MRIHYQLSLEESANNPILYLFPPIILWSPVEQFQGTWQMNFFCPKCMQLGDVNISLYASGWHDAMHGDRSEPRKIYMEVMELPF